MATLLLSAVGASLGAGFGGTVLGLSGAVIGRAVGATIGRAIDQRLLGQGSKAVETGRVDRMRIQTAGEGTAIARLWGQMRLPGHVIWAGFTIFPAVCFPLAFLLLCVELVRGARRRSAR